MSGGAIPGLLGSSFPLFRLAILSCAGLTLLASDALVVEQRPSPETLIQEKLAVWQQRLKLDEWTISIVMSHPRDLKPKTLGNIHWDPEKKSAVIRVLDVADYRMPLPEALLDIERTVVHELIHLELSTLPTNEGSRREEERAVNKIAEALLQLDHRQ
jgi:hypothetical protein